MIFSLSSCLDGDNTNIPTDISDSKILQMAWNPKEGTNLNAGLNYFAGQTLTFPINSIADTTTFAVTLQGANTSGKDIAVTAVVDMAAKADNFANDSIEYLPMPDEAFEFINSTATIKAGERTAEFKIIFHMTKLNPKLSYILPVTATNSSELPLSLNYGKVYFHTIGNPLGGIVTHDFIRYSNPAGTGSPDGTSFTGEEATFAPADLTTIHVPTGYYDNANYFITFTDNNGVLSNFKAVIDPASVNGAWATAGIEITSGPTITVNEDYTTFTIKYTTITRNVTDIYHR